MNLLLRKCNLIIMFLFWGCATESNSSYQDCPSVADEPVSECRARLECGNRSALGAISLFAGALAGTSENSALDTMNECVKRNIEIQQSNARFR